MEKKYQKNIAIESNIPKNKKFAFYILGLFPLVYIISLLTFYIHAGLVLDYKSISGINPSEFSPCIFYEVIIMYSYLASFFGFLVWIIVVVMYSNKSVLKPVIFISLLYIIALLFALPKIMEFAMD